MKIADVMTTEVVTATARTPLKELATQLLERRISGVPVVDCDGVVLGVVSEGDILFKERGRAALPEGFLGRLLAASDPELELKLVASSAAEAMTAPAVTIAASQTVQEAARLMLDHGVNRLPVVDGAGRLAGIVTRADLVRAFVRTDDEIRREIRETVLLRELWLDPRQFEVEVTRGEVTLRGPVDSEAEGALVRRRVTAVPGVVTVDARLAVGA